MLACNLAQHSHGRAFALLCGSPHFHADSAVGCAGVLLHLLLQAAGIHGLQQGLPPDKRPSDMGQPELNGHGSMQQAQQYDTTTQQIIVSTSFAASSTAWQSCCAGLHDTFEFAHCWPIPAVRMQHCICALTLLRVCTPVHLNPMKQSPNCMSNRMSVLLLQADLRASGQQAQQIESTMRHITTLNQMISTAVMEQAEMIEQLYNNALDATHNITRGNKELKKTIVLNRSSRNWVLVLSVVAALLLLFFDWFYS